MTDWQSIETAPRDGTEILVWFCGRMHVAAYKAILHPDNLKWCVQYPADGSGSPSNTVHDISQPKWNDGRIIPGGHNGPTHWMPLPPPPSLGRAG